MRRHLWVNRAGPHWLPSPRAESPAAGGRSAPDRVRLFSLPRTSRLPTSLDLCHSVWAAARPNVRKGAGIAADGVRRACVLDSCKNTPPLVRVSAQRTERVHECVISERAELSMHSILEREREMEGERGRERGIEKEKGGEMPAPLFCIDLVISSRWRSSSRPWNLSRESRAAPEFPIGLGSR